MAQIPSDLKNFKDSVESSIDSMEASASDLTGKLDSLIRLNESAKSEVDNSYQSDKKNDVLSYFGAVNSKCSSISKAFSSDIQKILNDCRTLVAKVRQLENYIIEIEALQAKLNNNIDENIRQSTKNSINNLNNSFDQTLTAAKSIYSGLKDFAGSIQDYSSDSSGINISGKLIGRKFEIEEFVVNGQTMRCYVYRPVYSENVKLPVMEFMYGLGMTDTGDGMATHNSLGKLINEGVVLPDDAMVVIPIVRNGMQYENKAFRDQLAQLPYEVAKKYNGDTSRISLGGTSYGAVTAYRLVNENPGKFSAIMAVYGAEEVTDAFKGMKVINYTGRGGGNHTDLNYIIRQTEKLKAVGADVSLVTYNDTWNHSNTGTRAFSEKKANGEFVVEDVLRYQKNKSTKNNS